MLYYVGTNNGYIMYFLHVYVCSRIYYYNITTICYMRRDRMQSIEILHCRVKEVTEESLTIYAYKCNAVKTPNIIINNNFFVLYVDIIIIIY